MSDINKSMFREAIKECLTRWVENGEEETTLSVTPRTDGRVEIQLSGDRVVYPMLLSDLIEYAGRSTARSPGEFFYLVRGFHRMKGIEAQCPLEPEEREVPEGGLTLKFKEDKDGRQ